MLCCFKLYNEELKNIKEFNYELPDGTNVDIKEQRIKCCEALFNPYLATSVVLICNLKGVFLSTVFIVFKKEFLSSSLHPELIKIKYLHFKY